VGRQNLTTFSSLIHFVFLLGMALKFHSILKNYRTFAIKVTEWYYCIIVMKYDLFGDMVAMV